MNGLLFILLFAARPAAGQLSADSRAAYEKVFVPRKGQVDRPRSAKARKGPVELELKVANTRISKEGGLYSLWLQVNLTNVGKKPFDVTDPPFVSPLGLDSDTDLFVEILDERKKELRRHRLNQRVTAPAECGRLEMPPDVKIPSLPYTLAPGQSISTPAVWNYDATEIACLGRSPKSPIPPYAEFRGVWFGDTKKARIRLVYRHGMSTIKVRRVKAPDEVDVATDWIELDVVD